MPFMPTITPFRPTLPKVQFGTTDFSDSDGPNLFDAAKDDFVRQQRANFRDIKIVNGLRSTLFKKATPDQQVAMLKAAMQEAPGSRDVLEAVAERIADVEGNDRKIDLFISVWKNSAHIAPNIDTFLSRIVKQHPAITAAKSLYRLSDSQQRFELIQFFKAERDNMPGDTVEEKRLVENASVVLAGLLNNLEKLDDQELIESTLKLFLNEEHPNVFRAVCQEIGAVTDKNRNMAFWTYFSSMSRRQYHGATRNEMTAALVDSKRRGLGVMFSREFRKLYKELQEQAQQDRSGSCP